MNPADSPSQAMLMHGPDSICQINQVARQVWVSVSAVTDEINEQVQGLVRSPPPEPAHIDVLVRG